MTRKRLLGIAASSLLVGATVVTLWPGAKEPGGTTAGPAGREHGRYLVQVGGCNDCHTPDYMSADGNVSEDRWLVGNRLGFMGPWGTTYPINLRLYMQALTEDEWVRTARTLKTRPPMPWFNLRLMNESDLRALYQYIRALPPTGDPVPAYVPPGGQPATPYIVFTPQDPER